VTHQHTGGVVTYYSELMRLCSMNASTIILPVVIPTPYDTDIEQDLVVLSMQRTITAAQAMFFTNDHW
jgi:hypothetical protein